MELRGYSNKEIVDTILSSLEGVLGRLCGMRIVAVEDAEDFDVGQRFYVETLTPISCVVFYEFALETKKTIIEKVFDDKWDNIGRVMKDDCFLEISSIITEKMISKVVRRDEPVKTGFPMIVFDEYEDELEVSTGDLFRFDFRMGEYPLSVILCIRSQEMAG